MQKLLRTNSQNSDFIKLVQKLDADLAKRDGEEHLFYAQFNKIDVLQHIVVLYQKEEALGCGAIKKLDAEAMEVKRMYTNPANRGKGLATNILLELEKWAVELGYKRTVLETGKKQHEAIRLYSKNGYQIIPNYGQYANVKNSLCFEKLLLK